ncbi:hypothetical protein CRD60_05625 [Bifidobacterium aemilianum]|uniref:Uncharacterized protein n=1 Tax=Bifidobacterium aemilianum TaxID=2493120 RepID=A0A366K8Y7_9BIFI|nr:InlB B-repeat-containing protein [Bifidobacterium aemilianum]RBP97712.1 hypothetical protein CRD60_05625 [Bifidobacterium aemilianum]
MDSAGKRIQDFQKDQVKADITLYDQWRIRRHQVSYDAAGVPGRRADGVHGQLLTRPKGPSRPGYGFDGWLTDDRAIWDFAKDRVTGDMTLHNRWAKPVKGTNGSGAGSNGGKGPSASGQGTKRATGNGSGGDDSVHGDYGAHGDQDDHGIHGDHTAGHPG